MPSVGKSCKIMPFDADIQACAALVQRGDPDRFVTVMAAPVDVRPQLFALYAFNVEVARAPWVTQEAMIGEMRLQWWCDALDEIAQGGPVRRHEVVTPLARVLTPDMAAQLDDLIAARRWDLYKDPFDDAAHFDRYIDATAGTLMAVAAQVLGLPDPDRVRDVAYGAGVAAWLQAVPQIEASKRIPMVDGTPAGVAALAKKALQRLQAGQGEIGALSGAARFALLPAWMAKPILKQACAAPQRVADGALAVSEFGKKTRLMWAAATGRF